MAFIEISDFLKLVQCIAKLNRNNICIHVHVAGYIVSEPDYPLTLLHSIVGFALSKHFAIQRILLYN